MRCVRREKGAVLVTALILLIVLTLIGLGSMDTGSLELRMADNEQLRTLAFQTAQAAIDEITEDRGNFVVSGGPGDTVGCTDSLDKSECSDKPVLTLSSPIFSADYDKASITRLAPAFSPPPRLRLGSSATELEATFFQIDAEHDAISSGQGRVALRQGFLLLIPAR